MMIVRKRKIKMQRRVPRIKILKEKKTVIRRKLVPKMKRKIRKPRKRKKKKRKQRKKKRKKRRMKRKLMKRKLIKKVPRMETKK